MDDVSSPQSSAPGAIFFGRFLVTCFLPVARSSALCFAFCRTRRSVGNTGASRGSHLGSGSGLSLLPGLIG
eukprot:5503063-Prorocentrum_lima.AAC.1